jgi:hypothetical protein
MLGVAKMWVKNFEQFIDHRIRYDVSIYSNEQAYLKVCQVIEHETILEPTELYIY